MSGHARDDKALAAWNAWELSVGLTEAGLVSAVRLAIALEGVAKWQNMEGTSDAASSALCHTL